LVRCLRRQQSAPIDQQNINKLPPALLRRYDVYVHAEKRIPAPDKELNAPAAADGKAGAATYEHPITPLRRVAAQHIGKLVRVRVSNRTCWPACCQLLLRLHVLHASYACDPVVMCCWSACSSCWCLLHLRTKVICACRLSCLTSALLLLLPRQGMVTHVTDVKPLASVLTYLDEDSNTEVYQEVRRMAGCARCDAAIGYSGQRLTCCQHTQRCTRR
jgi:hypothetical protein